MNEIAKGQRILLRELCEEDGTERYVRWLNDPEVNRFLESRLKVHDLASVKDYIRQINSSGNTFLFGIFDLSGNAHVGNIKIGPIHPWHRVAEVGLLLGERECWGRGFATEAISLASKYAFEKLAVHKLVAGAYQENGGSIRAFEKSGYKVEGVLKSHWLSDGRYQDGILLGLVKPDEE